MSINEAISNINSKSTQDQAYIETIIDDIMQLSGDDLCIAWIWTSSLVRNKGRL